MIETELIPIVFLDQLMEQPADLPPPQLHSGSSYSPSNTSSQLPNRVSSNPPLRAPETTEGSLEGLLQEEHQHHQAGERIENEEDIESQQRTEDIMIEEQEPNRETIGYTYSNTARTGPITKVFNFVI